MEEHIPIRIMIEALNQEVTIRVRRKLVTQELIDSLCQRYGLGAGSYALYDLRGDEKYKHRLDSTRTLGQNDLQENSLLVLRASSRKDSEAVNLIRRGKRVPLESANLVCVMVEGHRKPIIIRWQPAIIGRSDSHQSDDLLAVDLARYPEASSVASRHACLTRLEGQYYIERLDGNYSTYLNNQPLRPFQPQPLKPGDKIRVGEIVLIFSIHE